MKSPAHRLAALTLVLSSLLGAGCSAAADDDSLAEGDGDDGDSAATAEALSSSCTLSRDEILDSVAGARREAIERGFGWYDAKVPYSQARSHAGYRTDCSGFVSMCWELGRSYTTASFSSGTASRALRSYSELEPADALVYRRNGHGHIVLFLGWSDDAHTKACVLEQASTASDMQFRTRAVSSLKASGFKAIRADKLED